MIRSILLFATLFFSYNTFSQSNSGGRGCTPLSGTYTINSTLPGTTSNFISFGNAITSLINCDISGPVVFNVAEGTYVEQVTLPAITGSSSVNTITFQADPGNTLDAKVQFTSVAFGTNWVWQFNGTSNIILDGLVLESDQSGSFTRVIDLASGSDDITIQNCELVGKPNALTSSSNAVIYALDASNSNNNITIESNIFTGGSHGIYFDGNSTNAADQQLKIRNNVITDFSIYGIITYVPGAGFEIVGNNISSSVSGFIRGINVLNGSQGGEISGNSVTISNTSTAGEGIRFFKLHGPVEVSRNKVYVYPNGNVTGIELADCDATSGSHAVLSNNFVVASGTGTVEGITSGSTTTYWDYVFNNVLVNGTNATSTSAFYYNGSNNIVLQNNNLVVANAGNCIEYLTTGNALDANYNNLFSASGDIGNYGGTTTTSLALWQSTSGEDANSVSMDPQYTSTSAPYDLHIANSNLAGIGIAIPSITTDIDGDTRTTPPTIGADKIGGGPVCNLALNGVRTTDASCNGGNDGDIRIALTGGTRPYGFVWPGAISTDSFAVNLPAGTYSVTGSDANGCTVLVTATVNEPTSVAISLTQDSVSCFSFSDGSINTNPLGGTAPYQYSIDGSPYQSGTSISGLAAGTYTVGVRDANLCTISDTISVLQPPLLVYTKDSTNVTCFGANDGSAIVLATGGTPPYTYNWSNGTTTSSITSLAPGGYGVTGLDQSGCQFSYFYDIEGPSSALIVTVDSTDVSCNGAADGSLTVAASGGVPGYTFIWAGGINNSTINGLSAGSYSVTVIDTGGCEVIAMGTVLEPPLLSLSLSASDASCGGLPDGSITATGSGGTPSYEYSLDGAPFQSSGSFNGLTAGAYTVDVRDASGCTLSGNINVGQASSLSTTSGTIDASCFGFSNGEASISTSGGTPPYTYSWSAGGSTDSVATGLAAGSYSVTVTDANSCSVEDSVVLSEPIPISIITDIILQVSCNGAANGAIDVSATGGVQPYTYQWSNGASTSAIGNIASGVYNLTVTDNSGCQKVDSFTVLEPDPIVPTLNTSGNTISVDGSFSSYQWYLDGNLIAGAESGSYTATESGTYTVEVVSSNGCTGLSAGETITINGIDNSVFDLRSQIYPNPSAGSYTIQLPSNHPGDVRLFIYNTAGELVHYDEDISQSNYQINGESWSSGIYFIQLSGSINAQAKLIKH